MSVEWRKSVAFEAELAPGRLSRFSCRLEKTGEKPRTVLAVRDGDIRFQTQDLDVIINAATGFLDRYRVRGLDILAPNACRPLVLKDNADPWGMTVRSFRDFLGAFTLMDEATSAWFSGVSTEKLEPVRVIEDGEVRTLSNRSSLSAGHISACAICLPKRGTEIESRSARVLERKGQDAEIRFSAGLPASRFLGQAAYGRDNCRLTATRPSPRNGTPSSAGDGRALTIIND